MSRVIFTPPTNTFDPTHTTRNINGNKLVNLPQYVLVYCTANEDTRGEIGKRSARSVWDMIGILRLTSCNNVTEVISDADMQPWRSKHYAHLIQHAIDDTAFTNWSCDEILDIDAISATEFNGTTGTSFVGPPNLFSKISANYVSLLKVKGQPIECLGPAPTAMRLPLAVFDSIARNGCPTSFILPMQYAVRCGLDTFLEERSGQT